MIVLKIQEIVDCTGAELVRGNPEDLARGISTDTRTLSGGAFYVALSGPNFDGNRFAVDAARQGASGTLLQGTPAEIADTLPRLPGDFPVLVHREPRRALSDIASWYRERLGVPVIGVTGSCGKTTTKNILSSLLGSVRRVVASPNSFNNDIGVPHTLFLASPDTEALVVEMGTNHPGEIAALCRTARPSAGIVTNVGASHLEGLGSLEGVAQEKGALPASLPAGGFCVLNADCRFSTVMRSMTSARVVTFSVDGEGDLDATNVWFHSGGTTFELEGREITSPLLGLHNVQNLLAALAACRGLGIPLEDVLPAVTRLSDGRGRLERVEVGGLTILDDTYNANPESARASVRVLQGLHGFERRVLVLGEMLELGELAAELHHAIGREAAQAGLDRLVLVGPLARAAAAGALEAGMPDEHVLCVDDREAAVAAVPELVRAGDVVLVKGSRRTGLEELVAVLRARAQDTGEAGGEAAR